MPTWRPVGHDRSCLDIGYRLSRLREFLAARHSGLGNATRVSHASENGAQERFNRYCRFTWHHAHANARARAHALRLSLERY